MENNMLQNREQLIRKVLQMHKRWNALWNKLRMGMATPLRPELTEEWYEVKPDRFYLQESLTPTNYDDYENKKFEPSVQVCYLLRSQEARALGDKNNAFFTRRFETVSFEYEDLANPDAYFAKMEGELGAIISQNEA